VHAGKPDVAVVEELDVRAGAEARTPQLFECEMKEVEEAGVINDAGVVDIREPHGRGVAEGRHVTVN
jgi:hypothetical protein